MKKFHFNLMTGIMTLAIGTSLLVGCSRGTPAKKIAGLPVLVAQAATTNVPVQIDPPPFGHVTPYSTVTIRPQIGGILSEIHFQEGQEVKKGDLLFTIDPRPSQAVLEAARAALARDQAQLENAKIQFARDQKLFNDKIESQDVFDTSKANMDALAGTVQSDQAAITNAALNLEFTAIRSPIDGKTGSLQFHTGNVVKAPDDTLLTINQIHPICAVFAVPEQYLPEITKQMRAKTLQASVAFQNMAGPPPQGNLTFVDNAVDETTGTILLKATFPNTDGALWPGQFVQVTLTLSELKDAIVVPSQAVQTGQNGQFVYVVKPDQTAEQRPIVIGLAYQGNTIVQSGLKTGETVVTDGQLRLTPGVAVNIKSSSQSDAATTTTNAP